MRAPEVVALRDVAARDVDTGAAVRDVVARVGVAAVRDTTVAVRDMF